MTLRLAAAALRDVETILVWSGTRFGQPARLRYQALIKAGLVAITDLDPPTSRAAPELGAGTRLYHLRSVRPADGTPRVVRPRHFVLYRREKNMDVKVLRVLHEASDLSSRFIPPG